MDFATGAMSSLLPKLGELLLEEYDLQKGLKKGIKALRDELLIIEAALVKVSDVPLDQLDPLVKIWANDVRELSYAIEDSLDSFMVRVEGLEQEKTHTFLGFVEKTCKKVTKLKVRREIANEIKDVKIQVKEVKERYDRYKDIIGNSTSAVTKVDTRLFALYNKVSNLVGIDNAIDELSKRLSKCHDVLEQNLKIISIVGFGGLGKTTLAKAVYENLYKNFDCGSFVSVGRNPDQKKVLRDILYELDKQKYNYITESQKDERQLIDQLQEFLKDKRYLIVIDDIWDISTWEILKCALMDSKSGSKIITTTRMREVANVIGGVYNMKPLSDDNSKKLFYNRIFGIESISSHDQSSELTDKIVKKCGGVPLSIITLASLLVSKPRDDWHKVFETIGFGHEVNEAVENTRKVLAFSYYDLPFYLKTCLLHLSSYPEDCIMQKTSLIWKWVAESFIPFKEGIGAYEVAQSYYNDLINRSMIKQDVGIRDHCQVHDLVLDLIRSLSNEVNFVTVQERAQYNTCTPSTSNNARRLAVHGGSIEQMDMGHVRSFNAMRSIHNFLPPLLSFKVLRVLAIENCKFPVGGCHFEHLGQLVQLRYLGLTNTPVSELPTNIGHDLKFLQTLDVDGTGIKELPPSVGELTKLMCLIASKETTMMARIGNLTSLEQLELHHVDKAPDFTKDLGKLTLLRVLDIRLDEMDESLHKDLVKSVHSLRKIQVLNIWAKPLEVGDEWEEWKPPSELGVLMLNSICLPRRPSWMDPSFVGHLSRVTLFLQLLEAGDLRILGRLPLLRFLYLVTRRSVPSYTVGSHEFQNLIFLNINTDIVAEEGALPVLEELECNISVGQGVGLVGSIPSLQKITYQLDCFGRSREEVETAEAALRQSAQTHANPSYLRIKRIFCKSDEEEKRKNDQITASWNMLVELARTVVVLTMGKSNVPAEDLQDCFSSMLSSVLNNPVIPDLLSKLGSQAGLERSTEWWRSVTKVFAQKHTERLLNAVGQRGDKLSTMMQKMMPVVSIVLAELPPFEFTLLAQHNDDGKLGGKLDNSLQQENSGADTSVSSNEEAAPVRLP